MQTGFTFVAEDLPLRSVVVALGKAGFELGPTRPMRRTLLDTFDGRIEGAGLRLEALDGERTHLVLHGGGATPAQAAVEARPRFGADLPAGPLRLRLAPVLDVRALLPKLQVDAQQTVALRRNDAGKTLVRVILYTDVTFGPDRTTTAWIAAEVSQYEGYESAAERAARKLRSLGLSAKDGDLFDVVASRAGVDLGGFTGSPTVPLDPSEVAAVGFRRVLTNLVDTIDANWQDTVDATDPEFLHDFRVAVRRTRSVLSHGKGVLPDDGRDHFRTEFRWLGALTTPSRDLDVYLIEWPSYVAPLGQASPELRPVVDHIVARRDAEHAILAATLRSDRYRAVMTGYRAWIDVLDADGGATRKAKGPIGPIVAARLGAAQQRVLAGGRAIDAGSPAEALHELRKDAKKLRYLLECFGGVLPERPRKTFVQRLKALQDNLGEFQDTEVHTTQLRAMSEELQGAPGVTADTFLSMGRLTELFDQRRKEARDVFAERFAAYDTDPTARAMRKLLDTVGTP